MKKKRRGEQQQGPTHRITMTFPENLFKALSELSDKRGYSISAIARQTIDRAVGAGLLDTDTPSQKGAAVIQVTQFEQYAEFAEGLNRLHEDQLENIRGHLKLRDKLLFDMQQRLKEYKTLIEEQARDIALLRARKDG